MWICTVHWCKDTYLKDEMKLLMTDVKYRRQVRNEQNNKSYGYHETSAPDPDPAFYAEYRSGSVSRVFMTKNQKNYSKKKI